MSKKKMSRLEGNKEVRRILNRHGVDLSYCQYSVAGLDIRMTGWLCKYDGSDYHGQQIESMIQEFQRILSGYTISGDFDNWKFTTEHISFIGDKNKKDEKEHISLVEDDYDSEVG